MSAQTSAADFLPTRISMKSLREAASGCRGCDLYVHATQTVFGEGPVRAKLMFVGEQPGDSEDREGHPFVGPAGRILHEGFMAAGIDPKDVYITKRRQAFQIRTARKAADPRNAEGVLRFVRAGRGLRLRCTSSSRNWL